MNEMKLQSRREIQMRMLTLEIRVITSLRRVNDDVSEHSVHLTPSSPQRTNTPLRVSHVCDNKLFELCSLLSARQAFASTRDNPSYVCVYVCQRERVRVQRNWANVCPLAKLLSRNVYFGRRRLDDHGHTATGVLAKSWTSNRELTLA